MHITACKLTCYIVCGGKSSLSDETILWKHAVLALTAFASNQESPVWHFTFSDHLSFENKAKNHSKGYSVPKLTEKMKI